ncbi:MAG TPA: ABC transporter ATP-binding protein, partial [Acholeplasmataceae bacterium]|nr:ABC transporter ATP-binding protein [Acholeplasmataceae bacterium]
FGLEQQKGEPQSVYDNPTNQFVAQFLGTPPINLYEGVIKNGKLFIGNSEIRSVEGFNLKEDEGVTVGIRPEAYIPVKDPKQAKLVISYNFVESIGRDIGLVSTHPESLNESFRIIIRDLADITPDKMNFDLNLKKVFVFRKISGERVI